jgi:Zn-dependent M32 family carboxypeptidase
MSQSSAYASLLTRFTRLHRYAHLAAMAGWDQATMMPPKGNEARAAAQAELEVLMHATLTDPPWRKPATGRAGSRNRIRTSQLARNAAGVAAGQSVAGRSGGSPGTGWGAL